MDNVRVNTDVENIVSNVSSVFKVPENYIQLLTLGSPKFTLLLYVQILIFPLTILA